jgi:hypothetical protein
MVGNIWIFPSSPLETSIPQEKESSPSQSAAGRPMDAFSQAWLPVYFSLDVGKKFRIFLINRYAHFWPRWIISNVSFLRLDGSPIKVVGMNR